jgi:hypothetical protein
MVNQKITAKDLYVGLVFEYSNNKYIILEKNRLQNIKTKAIFGDYNFDKICDYLKINCTSKLVNYKPKEQIYELW